MTEFTPRQLALIEQHRDINVDYEWWEFTYEDFIGKMHDVGIETSAKQMSFSGFGSQGDGAAFEGSIYDWTKFLAQDDLKTSHPEAALLIKLVDSICIARIENRGRSFCIGVEFEWDGLGPDPDNLTDAMAQVAFEAVFEPTYRGSKQEAFEEAVVRICEDHAADLYSSLEDEYEHLTSDEAIWETLEANDMQDDVPDGWDEEDDDEEDDEELVALAA